MTSMGFASSVTFMIMQGGNKYPSAPRANKTERKKNASGGGHWWSGGGNEREQRRASAHPHRANDGRRRRRERLRQESRASQPAWDLRVEAPSLGACDALMVSLSLELGLRRRMTGLLLRLLRR